MNWAFDYTVFRMQCPSLARLYAGYSSVPGGEGLASETGFLSLGCVEILSYHHQPFHQGHAYILVLDP